MSPSQRLGASLSILCLPLIGFLLAIPSCGGGSSKADAGPKPPAGDGGVVDRGSVGSDVGTGGGSDVGPIGTTGPEQCRSFVGVLCARLAECDMDPTIQVNCNKFLNVEFGCDRATSTDFLRCIQDTRALTCDVLFPAMGNGIPDSCTTPLDIPLSDAQQKCIDLVAANCTRSYGCVGVAMPTMAQLNACIQDVITRPMGIPCFDAITVGPKYAMCVNEIKALPCPPPKPDGGAPDAGMPPMMGDGGMMSAAPSCDDQALTFVQ